jgi:hypothetical protein
VNEDRFGYVANMPENIRIIFMWLCQDVASLQSKWDFYLELYDDKNNTEIMSDLASWSFNIIEESLRNDMTMAICRLSDPTVTLSKDNLSLATLVKKCSDIPSLDERLSSLQVACESVSKYRNKRVAHNDLRTRISPKENPLPGINKVQIDQILKLAADILNTVILHYVDSELYFHTFSLGDAKDLMFWLKAGQEHHSHAQQ